MVVRSCGGCFGREVADERAALGEVKRDMRSVMSSQRCCWEHEIRFSVTTAVTLEDDRYSTLRW